MLYCPKATVSLTVSFRRVHYTGCDVYPVPYCFTSRTSRCTRCCPSPCTKRWGGFPLSRPFCVTPAATNPCVIKWLCCSVHFTARPRVTARRPGTGARLPGFCQKGDPVFVSCACLAVSPSNRSQDHNNKTRITKKAVTNSGHYFFSHRIVAQLLPVFLHPVPCRVCIQL